MKVSVIIPSYKPKEYLWKCLDSIANQTFPKEKFEVIIVLNGCCEPWKSQIEAFIKSRMNGINVNFIQTEEGGVSNARNISLDVAKGEYVTFIDDDDYVSPNYIEELYSNASPDTISLCNALFFNDGECTFKEYYVTKNYKETHSVYGFQVARKYFSGTWMKLIHRDIIGNRRFDKRFVNGEDALFMFLISDRFKYVKFTPKDAIYYRRVRNDSAQFRKKSAKEILLNTTNMIFEYSKIYFRHPFSYNFGFYFTRVLAAIHGAWGQFVL